MRVRRQRAGGRPRPRFGASTVIAPAWSRRSRARPRAAFPLHRRRACNGPLLQRRRRRVQHRGRRACAAAGVCAVRPGDGLPLADGVLSPWQNHSLRNTLPHLINHSSFAGLTPPAHPWPAAHSGLARPGVAFAPPCPSAQHTRRCRASVARECADTCAATGCTACFRPCGRRGRCACASTRQHRSIKASPSPSPEVSLRKPPSHPQHSIMDAHWPESTMAIRTRALFLLLRGMCACPPGCHARGDRQQSPHGLSSWGVHSTN